MGLRTGNLAALHILARELDLGPVPPPTHGPSKLLVLRDWFVVRDGMVDVSCTPRVIELINERLALHFTDGKWDVIKALHYAAAVLIRGEA